MGKRAAIVLSSSDDDNDIDFSVRSDLSRFKNPKSKAVSVPRSNPKRSKKTRISSSSSHPGKNVNPFDEVMILSFVHVLCVLLFVQGRLNE